MSKTIPWDEIDVDRLLPLVDIRRMDRRFGVLLRHYWLPATELLYERTENNRTQSILRKPLKCDADVCLWRESTDGDEERLCVYSRSEQTFRSKIVTDFDTTPQDEQDAKIAAFVNVPVLTPLLPVPIGFQWHVPAKTGFMNFTLCSETAVGTMPIVFVRREGRFVYEGNEIHREGVTVIALNRSTILEDRTRDVFPETGLERVTTLRLVRSQMIPE